MTEQETIRNNDNNNNNNNNNNKISQYDVLVIPKEHETGAYELYQPTSNNNNSNSNIVGNNRYIIFIKMNIQKFINSITIQEQENVVTTVYNIVSKQCIDTNCKRAGIFLSLKSDYLNKKDNINECNKLLNDIRYWVPLNIDEAKNFVRDSLEDEQQEQAAIDMPPPPPPVMMNNSNTNEDEDDDDKKRRRRSSLLRRSLSSGNMLDDEKKRIDLRKSLLLRQLQEFDVDSDDDGDDNDDNNDNNKNKNESNNTRNIEENYQGKEDNHQKPAAAATVTGTGTIMMPPPLSPSRKNNNSNSSKQKRLSYERSPSWTGGSSSSVAATTDNNINISSLKPVHTANALDVILTISSYTEYTFINKQHTGNNRVQVMIQIQLNKYISCCNDNVATHKLCRDLVDTIQSQYNARFLIEQNSNNNDNNNNNNTCYYQLNDEQAAKALETIFAAQATGPSMTGGTTTTATTSFDSTTTTNSTVGATTNTAAADTNNGITTYTTTNTSYPNNTTFDNTTTTTTTGTTKKMKRPSIVKKEILQKLHSLPKAVNTVVSASADEDVHKTAIASLQKRKKRQGVNNKISSMVASNFGGTPAPNRLGQRSQSESILPMTQHSSMLQSSNRQQQQQQPPMMPPAPTSNIPRYASTGMTIQEQQMQHQYQRHQLSSSPGLSPRPIEEMQHHEHEQPQPPQHLMMPQQQQQQYNNNNRRPTLSEFSQDMIKDMLRRLEVDNDDDDEVEEVYDNNQYPPPPPGYHQGRHYSM